MQAAIRKWSAVGSLPFLFAVVLLLSFACVNAGLVNKREISGYSGEKEKRPFCNAFTGCGKKRSSSSGIEAATSAELEELARHVLAEARLWEQLQNKVEMMRTLASQMDDRQLYRKKRSANFLHFQKESDQNKIQTFQKSENKMNFKEDDETRTQKQN